MNLSPQVETEPFVPDPQRLTAKDQEGIAASRRDYPTSATRLRSAPRMALTAAEHFLIGSTALGLGGYPNLPQICFMYPEHTEQTDAVEQINEKRLTMAFTLHSDQARQLVGYFSFTPSPELGKPIELDAIKAVHLTFGKFDGQTVAPPQISKIELHDGSSLDGEVLTGYVFDSERFAQAVSQDYKKKIARYTELSEADEDMKPALHALQASYALFQQYYPTYKE